VVKRCLWGGFPKVLLSAFYSDLSPVPAGKASRISCRSEKGVLNTSLERKSPIKVLVIWSPVQEWLWKVFKYLKLGISTSLDCTFI